MSELPQGWTAVEFGELNTFSSRTINPSDFPDEVFELYSVPIFPMGKPELLSGKEIGSTKQLVEPGDVLVCKINPRINRVWVVGSPSRKRQIASSEWIVMRAEKHEPLFLRHYFSSTEFRELLCTDLTGVGGSLTRAQPKRVATYEVPVAPFAEQKRIAGKLDTLLARVDATRSRLDRIPILLKRFRQSILAAATSGKLTEDWRQEQLAKASVVPVAPVHHGSDSDLPPPNEQVITSPNSDLRWASQSQLDIHAEEIERNLANERKARWTGRGKYRPAYKAHEQESQEFLEVPNGWYRATLDEVTWSVKDGPHFSPKYQEAGIPFISGGSIKPGVIDLSISKFISSELNSELSMRCKPEKLDLLYTKGGTTGYAAVNTLNVEFNVWVHVAVLKLLGPTLINPFYIQHALNSPECYAQAQRYTHGVGNQDLGLTRMIKIVLLIPSIDEQKEIVRRVESLFALADKLESRYITARAQVDKLTPALLAKAFRGELVPQDPNDEPADQLLARIRTAREAAPDSAKKIRKPRQAKESA
jgi:type I restriction enzyme S subunit